MLLIKKVVGVSLAGLASEALSVLLGLCANCIGYSELNRAAPHIQSYV